MFLALSTNFVTFHALVFEIGRVSSIITRSPSLYSLFSEWAWYFFDSVTIFPSMGWRTRRSINTVTVLFILSLTTRPVRARITLVALVASGALVVWVSLICWPPSVQ